MLNKKVSCRRKTVRLLRGSVLAKHNWTTMLCEHYGYVVNHCDIDDSWPAKLSSSVKNAKIRAITPFKVIQGHRCRYQSKARMRLAININWHTKNSPYQRLACTVHNFCPGQKLNLFHKAFPLKSTDFSQCTGLIFTTVWLVSGLARSGKVAKEHMRERNNWPDHRLYNIVSSLSINCAAIKEVDMKCVSLLNVRIRLRVWA